MLSLYSCSTLPSDYKEPAINVPDNIKDANNSSALANLPYLAWWQKFNEPILNRLTESALIYNNDLQIATQNIEVAQAQLDTIELGWIPGLNLYAGFSQNPVLTNPGMFAFVQPNYITNFFTTYYQQKQAKYNLEQVKALKLGVKLTVIGQITAAYFSLLAWQKQLNILLDKQQNYQKLIEITQKAQSVGLANSLQITSLQSQKQIVDGEINKVEKNIVASNNAIRFLINKEPGEIKTDKSIDQINGEIITYKKINVKVIANRPDIMSAFRNLEAVSTGINVTASQLLPSVDIDEFAGVASLNGKIALPNQTANFGDTYALVSISPQTFGSINADKEIFRREVINYNKTIQNALKDVANSIDAAV